MKSDNVGAKLKGIETQIKILKNLTSFKKKTSKQKDLRSLKGILKGEGKFDIKQIESVKIKLKEKL